FDLLLLDIHMPELDGFGVVGEIRERERTAGGHLPVIALTARSRKEDPQRCLRAGTDEDPAKPVPPPPPRPPPPPAPSPPPAAPPPAGPPPPRGGVWPPAGATPPCSGRCAGRSSPASQSTWRRSETPCTIRTPCAYAKRLTSSTACFRRSPRPPAIRRPT